jgi:hypothetical protein
MRALLVLCISAGATLSAQVRYNPNDHAISIDGKPFTTFEYGAEAGKPFLAPLRSASGKIVTRRFPMETVEGESRDHLHHRGLWFSYDDVNGVKFWENDPSYKRGPLGRIVVTTSSWKDKGRAGSLNATMEWRGPDGKPLLVEKREMTFPPDPKLRIIDFHVTLTAATNVTIGDTKEGAFAIRLAEPFTARRGGRMVDSEGREGMKAIWGKRANWVDYTAEVDGERLGVAIFDHPSSFHHPAYWHARDYGLFSLNPLGQNAFDPSAPESIQKLGAGEKLEFRWRVVVHPGDAQTGRVAELYREYVSAK